MPKQSLCPDQQTLEKLAVGDLPREVFEPLLEHFTVCSTCADKVKKVTKSDTLLDALRHVDTASDLENAPAVKELGERLAKFLESMARSGSTLPTLDFPASSRATKGPALAPVTAGPEFLAAPQEPDEIGRMGQFRVLRVLGQGGMGMVLEAEDPHLKRRVALKVMLPHYANNPQAKKRFLREAQAAAALDHDHIITIHQVGEEGGVPFLTMPLLKGQSLSDRLQRTPVLPVPEILRIGREIAEGLAAAHETGLIHRDIKPSNIWLERRGEGRGVRGEKDKGPSSLASRLSPLFSRVKILDFGLARPLSGDELHLTGSGAVLGTPSYMAPEQARGLELDPRADLFSLGCVLYRMSTGDLPYQGNDTFAILTALAVDSPADPRLKSPDLPPALSDLILRLLAKRPSDRPTSAAALAATLAELERTLPPPPVSTTVARQPEAPAPSRPRRRRVVGLVALALFLVIGGGVLVPQIIIRIRNKDGSETKIEVDKNSTVTLEKDGKKIAEVPSPPARSPLDNLDPAKIPLSERFPWQPKELVAVLGKHQQKHWGGAAFVSVSSDGTLVASRSSPFRPNTRELLNVGLPTKVWNTSTMTLRTDYLPLSTSAPITDSQSLVLLDAETGKTVRTLAKDAGSFASLAFSENGNLLLTGGHHGDRRLRLWQVEDGKVLWSHQLESFVKCVALSRDGGLAMSNIGGKVVHLWDAKTGKSLRALEDGPADVGCIAFSPDASQAVAGDLEGHLIFWEVATGKKTRQIDAHASFVNSVCYSRDGRHVLSGSQDTWARVWDLETGKPTISCGSAGHAPIAWATFSADEKRIFTADDRGWVRLWDVTTGKELLPPEGPHGSVTNITFSTDGSRLYTAAFMQATCWNAETGTALKIVPIDRNAARASTFSPLRQQALTGRWVIQVLDMEAGKETKRSEPVKAELWSLAFLPDGKRALSASSDGVVRLWDLATLTEIKAFPGGSVAYVTGDGRHALIPLLGKDFSMGLWEIESGKQVRRFHGHTDQIWNVSFAPDGLQAATVGKDKTIRIWDLFGPNSEPKLVLTEHTSPVAAVAYAPDGKSLISAGWNGQLILSDLPSGEKNREWRFPGPISAVAFAPDGRHIVTGNGNGTAYVLRLAPVR